jgi:hypothetical protein
MLASEKENKQTAPKVFFYTYEESSSTKLLGIKPKKSKEETEGKNDSNKTNIHGIIFKRNDEKTVKKISCNCKNSQCLKLYCECFSKLGFCDPEICSCKRCANTKENKVNFHFFLILILCKNYKSKNFYYFFSYAFLLFK